MKRKQQIENMKEHALLSWEAPIHPQYSRSVAWYVCAVGIAAVLFGYSIWTGAWSFTLVLALLSAMYIWNHRTENVKKTIYIFEQGLLYGEELILWNACNGFWMLEAEDYVELHFEKKEGRVRDIKVQTGDLDIVKLRELLVHFVPEFHDRHERVLDMIERLLKI